MDKKVNVKSLDVEGMLGRLKAKREECGYTQEEVAELLDCERSSISLYETGKRGISIELLFKFSRIYHVSADYILNDKEPEYTSNLISDIRKLCDQYERCNLSPNMTD